MALAQPANSVAPRLADRSDDQLMAAYARKDSAAFDELYSRYKGVLYGYLVKNCRDEGIASEMFQDVWLRVITASADYQGNGRFRSWLFTLAHNRLVDSWRRADNNAVIVDVELASSANVEAAVSEGQEQNRLARMIDGLPLEQRQAFYLKEECGFAVKEIAAVQGINVEAAKSRLRYAYSKLREAFKEET